MYDDMMAAKVSNVHRDRKVPRLLQKSHMLWLMATTARCRGVGRSSVGHLVNTSINYNSAFKTRY